MAHGPILSIADRSRHLRLFTAVLETEARASHLLGKGCTMEAPWPEASSPVCPLPPSPLGPCSLCSFPVLRLLLGPSAP